MFSVLRSMTIFEEAPFDIKIGSVKRYPAALRYRHAVRLLRHIFSREGEDEEQAYDPERSAILSSALKLKVGDIAEQR